MVFAPVFILEVVFLFFLSKTLTRSLYFLPVNLISFLFLPGIIIHELSHFLVASLLFVPVGDIEFMPQVTDGELKLGSVSIGKTDPIRRFLIGVAPIVFGLSVVLGVCYFVQLNGVNELWTIAIAAYILFGVGNTMFSSKKDMEGGLVLLVVLVIFFIAVFLSGFRIQLSWLQSPFFVKIFESLQKADLYLLILIGLDSIIYSLIKLIKR